MCGHGQAHTVHQQHLLETQTPTHRNTQSQRQTLQRHTLISRILRRTPADRNRQTHILTPTQTRAHKEAFTCTHRVSLSASQSFSLFCLGNVVGGPGGRRQTTSSRPCARASQRQMAHAPTLQKTPPRVGVPGLGTVLRAAFLESVRCGKPSLPLLGLADGGGEL